MLKDVENMANVFSVKHYVKIAELIGKAKDLDEFYRNFVKFAQAENPKFSIEKFYNAVQKAHQFGEEAQTEAEIPQDVVESDGQPDEAQEWESFDPDA